MFVAVWLLGYGYVLTDEGGIEQAGGVASAYAMAAGLFAVAGAIVFASGRGGK
jgi:hypothetical protein